MKYDLVFSDRLAELREKNKISQNDLDLVLGYNDEQVSNFERGACFPKYETLLMIADYFNISLDYLVGRSNDPILRP